MTVDFYWRLPMHGDSSAITEFSLDRGDWSPPGAGRVAPAGDGEAAAFSYVDHVADIARAAEISGFYGALVINFPHTDDPWVAAAALAAETKTLRFMVAFQPGFLQPVQAARMSATLQALSGGRLVYNVITGGGGPAQLWWGDPTPHDERYARTTEFLDVVKGVWNGGPFDYDGRHFHIEKGGLPELLAGEDFPEIYFSGSSDAAIASAGRHADYYLSWMEPLDALKPKMAHVREQTEAQGRTARFAIRVEILARDTEEAAWAEVSRAWDNIDAAAFERWHTQWRAGESVGAQRQAGFRPTTITGYRDLTASPNLWGGFSLLRGGPGFGLVGSYEQVAERLDELIGIGVNSFILAGTPHLEEAHRVGEEVLPLLGR